MTPKIKVRELSANEKQNREADFRDQLREDSRPINNELCQKRIDDQKKIEEKEKFLFKVSERVLQWAKVKYEKEELADLIALELLDY